MKIYIPFNSNDFNSMFTTLSLSPRIYYPVRNYSFKRATRTLLNPLEETLIGYSQSVFTTLDFDLEDGFTINLLIDVPNGNLYQQGTLSNQVDFFFIPHTVYLYGGFTLIFRSEDEREAVFSKSLKSIETKFSVIAKKNSVLYNEVQPEPVFINYDELSHLQYETGLDSQIFEDERKINKLQGALVGFLIGNQKNVGPEFIRLNIATKELRNITSVFINSINANDYKNNQNRLIDCLTKICLDAEKLIPLDETLILTSDNLTPALLSALKTTTLFGLNGLDILKEGLIHLYPADLPIQLKIEKLKRTIGYKYNPKFSESNSKKINELAQSICDEVNTIIKVETINNDLKPDQFLQIVRQDSSTLLQFEMPKFLTNNEKEYFNVVLKFLINEDSILNTDILFSNRELYLTNIGVYLNKEISDFNNSSERQYILTLLKSFKSLRMQFEINASKLDTLKSLALLLTSGRDFAKYMDGVNGSSIESVQISLALWGATYGFASFSKLLTSEVLESERNQQLLLELLSKANYKFQIQTRSNSEPSKVQTPDLPLVVPVPKAQSVKIIRKKEKEDAKFNLLIANVTKLKKIPKDSVIISILKSCTNTTEELNPTNNNRAKYFEQTLKEQKGRLKGYSIKNLTEIAQLYKDIYVG